MNNGTMLNAYPDSMGGTLSDIASLLETEDFRDVFRSFYILPSLYNTDLDRGFSVISYDLEPSLSRPEDLDRIRRAGIDLKLDFILNHLSVLSPQFQDLLARGDASPYRDFFIDWNRFWQGHGTMTDEGYIRPDAEDLRDMFFRKPGLPVLTVEFPDGRRIPYWNTFYQQVWELPPDETDLMRSSGLTYRQAERIAARVRTAQAEGKSWREADFTGLSSILPACEKYFSGNRRYLGQMDLNTESHAVWEFYAETLRTLASRGASIVRLDAFAYASKLPGRRNFLNLPETWQILERIEKLASPLGLTLLPEIHSSYGEGTWRDLAKMGYMTYDFFLPGLMLDALERADGSLLISWARTQIEEGIRTVNMLGCHDGIPLLDLKGLLPEERIRDLIALTIRRGGIVKDLDGQQNMYYQVNAAYYSALGADDRKLLLARALQLFMPGKPQIWYMDLFAWENDTAAVTAAGAGGHKEINRSNLSGTQIREALRRPVVQRQLKLLRFRNTCPAFGEGAAFDCSADSPSRLTLRWRCKGTEAVLEADLALFTWRIQINGEAICI